jgi:hypothetical protein
VVVKEFSKTTISFWLDPLKMPAKRQETWWCSQILQTGLAREFPDIREFTGKISLLFSENGYGDTTIPARSEG